MEQFIKSTILAAGRLARQYRKHLSSLEVESKSEKDLVSEADRAVERLIRKRIEKNFPDHTIVGEEYAPKEGCSKLWRIDPIDGTVSFLYGQLHYCVSIAYEENGETKYGAVYAPETRRLFFAAAGKGAEVNGRPIFCRKTADPAKALLTTGFACIRSGLKQNNLPVFSQILPQILASRRFGSAALDLCYVACGEVDGFWEMNLNSYDIAAGVLIAREAGAKVCDFSGKTGGLPSQVVAAWPPLADWICGEVRKAFDRALPLAFSEEE